MHFLFLFECLLQKLHVCHHTFLSWHHSLTSPKNGLKHGEETTVGLFSIFISWSHENSTKQIKIICHIHFKTFWKVTRHEIVYLTVGKFHIILFFSVTNAFKKSDQFTKLYKHVRFSGICREVTLSTPSFKWDYQ